MDNHEKQPARHVNQIKIADLAKMIEALATLQPDGSQPISAATAIKGRLQKPIKAAIKRGVSYAQLVAILRDAGVQLTAETLKGYLREGGKPAKTDKPKTKIAATTAPQEQEPAAIQAASAKPQIAVNKPEASATGVVATPVAPMPHPAVSHPGAA